MADRSTRTIAPSAILDARDRAILAALQRDARASNKSLARQVGLSQSACLQRVKRLEQSGIIRHVRAHLDHAALGLDYRAWVVLQLRNNTPQTLQRLREALAAAPCVLEAHELVGPFDVLARVSAATGDDWRSLAAMLETEGLISGARVALIQSELKPPSPVQFD